MSESSANLEILDNEDIYSVCVLIKQYVVHIQNTLKMVYSDWMNLIKISQDILRIWRYTVLTHFFLLHAYLKQKGVDWGCYRRSPSLILYIGVSSCPFRQFPSIHCFFVTNSPLSPSLKIKFFTELS